MSGLNITTKRIIKANHLLLQYLFYASVMISFTRVITLLWSTTWTFLDGHYLFDGFFYMHAFFPTFLHFYVPILRNFVKGALNLLARMLPFFYAWCGWQHESYLIIVEDGINKLICYFLWSRYLSRFFDCSD